MNAETKTSEPMPPDFQALLQAEFIRRCRANARYSVRAFAKYLQIDSSTLSQILRGKRNLSPAMRMKLGHRLGFSPEVLARYVGKSAAESGEAKDLTLDTFQMISDWYHHAIYELVTVAGFQPDSKWIARKLGISSTEAQMAMDRLLRLELVRVEADGAWRQGSPLLTTTGTPFTTSAFRKFQAQVIQKAAEALEAVPIEARDQSSLTVAMRADRLPEAKELIRKFRREFCRHVQQDEARDSVYQLGISFYPLTLTTKESA